MEARDLREMPYADYLALERAAVVKHEYPTVLVEVLSDSTETDDRGEKWAHYQRVPSLRECVLVSQHARRIEVFSRDGADPRLWHDREHREGARAALPAVAVELDVDSVYLDPLADAG